MPALKDLACHVQWSDTGSPFPEYGTQYGDGLVETYIAIPNHPQTFNVRLTSERFISEGLVMVVFIDGNYQCNRVRVNLQPHKKGLPENRSKIDFVVRQKEKPLGDGSFVGREWRFDDYNVVPQLPAGVSESHFEELGTIEVLVLRCRGNDPNAFEISSDSSGEDSTFLQGNTHEDKDESDSVDCKSTKTAIYQPVSKTDSGVLGGIFDGAADHPTFSQVAHGDAPADGYPQWEYIPQEDPRYPQARFPGPVLENAYQYRRHPLSPPRPPVDYPRPRPERHVHFDYGDGRRLNTGYDDHQARRRFEPADEYHRQGHYTGRNPYGDYPRRHAERYYDYGGGPRDYSDYPARYQDYGRYRPRSPGPDLYPAGAPASFPSVPGLSDPRSAPHHAGMGPFPPVAPLGTAHVPTVWPAVHPQAIPQPFPVWVPPPTVPIPPQYPGTVPTYPPAGNAPLFHTQYHGYPLGTQNNAPTAGVAPGVAPFQNYNQQNAGSALPQGSLPSQQANQSFANPAPVIPNNSTSGGTWTNNTGGVNPQNNTSAGNNDAWGPSENLAQNKTKEDKSWEAGNSNNDQTWDSNNNNNTTNNTDNWGGKSDTPSQGQGWDNNTKDAGNSTWSNGDQNHGAGWENNDQNHGASWDNNDQNHGAGWDNNNTSNDSWDKQGHDNNTSNNDKPGEGWDTASASNTKEAPQQAVSKASKKALYGPHGAYQAPRFLANTDVPVLAEEEPRYDVPQAIAQARGTSKQVQPGRGYLYNKKSCHPEYVDSLDNPYARFVFKYRTKDQIKKETGVDVTVEPTGNEDVNALAALNKDELIQMVIRAKGALKGAIPEVPPKSAARARAPVKAFEPVPLPAPEHDYLKYKLPTGRPGSGLVGLGIRFPDSKASNSGSGGGGASQSNNDWSKGGDQKNWGSGGENNNWDKGGDSNQQASNSGNNQSWQAAEASGWNDNDKKGTPGRWDGPDSEADDAGKQKEQGQSQKRTRNSSGRVSVESSKTTIDHRPKLDPRRRSSGISPKDKSGLSTPSPQLPIPAPWQNPFGPNARMPAEFGNTQAPAKALPDPMVVTSQPPRTGPYADYTGPGAPNPFGIPDLPPDSAYAMPGPSNSGRIWDSYFTQPLQQYTDWGKPNTAAGTGATAVDPLNPSGIFAPVPRPLTPSKGPGPRPPTPGPDTYIPPLSPSPDPNEFR
nr:hypothetical protein LTR18_004199 [Exophiala xenobiotica]